jgi:ATP-binding cassette subfamily G (WHITE) protein 2
LNTLACRLDVNTIVHGEMRLNGAPYNNAELKRIAGYVMQDDLLNGSLTVEETLTYTAELRLPRKFTNKQRRIRVEEVMADLGLTHVRNVIIGTSMKRGISGGERKRLCVGMQLLNRPQLLFLDEPTSGLDSVTALDLIRTFHSLAHAKSPEKAVTIVCSIHQPQSKIFNLFDSLILLKLGNIIYQGPRKEAMVNRTFQIFINHILLKFFQETFRAAGFPCPLYTNPADHLLDVITPSKSGSSTGNNEAIFPSEHQSMVDRAIIAAQTPITVDLNMGVHKRLAQMADLPLNPMWHNQVRILLRRNFQGHRREARVIITSIIQTIIIAVLIGTAFLQIGQTQTSTVRRQPVLFFCVINQGIFGALMVINSFPMERALTLRERASGTYLSSAYFTAKIIADTLVQIPVPILFVSYIF